MFIYMNNHSHREPFAELGKKDRRAALLAAATEVFAEVGFAGATVRRIADEAGVATGTLYNYFPNKEALLLGIAKALREEHERNLPQAELNVDGLEAFIGETLAGIELVWPQLKVVVQQMLVDPQLAQTVEVEILNPLRQRVGIACRDLAADRGLEAETLVRMLAAPAIGLIGMRLLGDPFVIANWEALVDHLPAQMIAAVTTAPTPHASEAGA